LKSVAISEGWTVEWRDETYTFMVKDGVTIDEPLAGYYNAILRKDGQAFARANVKNGTTLMLDVGGQTTDIGVIDRGGEIDYSSFDSEDIGVLRAVEQFGKDYRADNRDLLRGSDIDRMELHNALRTGWLDLRGLNPTDEKRGYDVSIQADEIRANLAGEAVNFYE